MLREGEIFGRYQLERPLGVGGMGVVWLARHTDLGSQHAIKTLLSDVDVDDRLRTEGHIMASLAHPNVVRVTDLVEIAGRPALVMEYVSGGTLAERLAKGRLDPETIDRWGACVLRGVAAAHDRGWVHRDLKPQNVLLDLVDGEIVPKIADFGIAKVLDGEEIEPMGSTTRGGIGTERYMCLEQLLGRPPEPSFDVFALGALLYELCEGRPAFPTLSAWERAIRSGEHPALTRALPERMHRTVRAALASAKERAKDARALLALWIGEGAEEEAPSPSGHLAPERQLASLLTPAERAHLAICVPCRLERDLARQAVDALGTGPGSGPLSTLDPAPVIVRPRRWPFALGATAAALGALLWAAGRGEPEISDASRWSLTDLREVVREPPSPWIASAVVEGDAMYLIPVSGGALLRHDGADPSVGWTTFDAKPTPDPSEPTHALPGAASDGRYLYVSPLGDGTARRYDEALPFDRASSWDTFDLSAIVDPAGMLGCAVFDGRYVYFGPQDDGRVVRYDTRAPFSDPAAWEDASMRVGGQHPFGGGRFGGDSATRAPLAAFVGAVFDGRYVYWVPSYHGGWWGVVPRYDPSRPFDDPSAWSSFDTSALDGRAEGFSGGVFDGRWLYLVPGFSDESWWSSTLLRYDTAAPFDARGSWESFDLRALDTRAKGYSGATFDGRWLTLVPFDAEWGGLVARHDTTAVLDEGWSTFDLASLHPAAVGFAAGASRGRSTWLLPFWGNRGKGEDRPAYIATWEGERVTSPALTTVGRGSPP